MACSAADLPVTSPFGWRSDPYTGEWKFHTGVDLGYDYGAGVPALWDGVVVLAGDSQDGYGNQVLLYHPAIDVYSAMRIAQRYTLQPGKMYPLGKLSRL